MITDEAISIVKSSLQATENTLALEVIELLEKENKRLMECKAVDNMFPVGYIVAGWRKDIITDVIKDAKFEKYNLPSDISDINLLLFKFGYLDSDGNFIVPEKDDIWIRIE